MKMNAIHFEYCDLYLIYMCLHGEFDTTNYAVLKNGFCSRR